MARWKRLERRLWRGALALPCGRGSAPSELLERTEAALGQRCRIWASRFLGLLTHSPTGKCSLAKRGLPSLRSSGNMAALRGEMGEDGGPPRP